MHICPSTDVEVVWLFGVWLSLLKMLRLSQQLWAEQQLLFGQTMIMQWGTSNRPTDETGKPEEAEGSLR